MGTTIEAVDEFASEPVEMNTVRHAERVEKAKQLANQEANTDRLKAEFAAKVLPQLAEPKSRSRLDVDAIQAWDPMTVESLVGRDLWLDLGQGCLFAGASGAGKSSVLIQIQVAFATNTEFCGMKSNKGALTVMNAQSENNVSDYNQGLKGSALWAGDKSHKSPAEIWKLIGENAMMLPTHAAGEELFKELAQEWQLVAGWKVLILDPLVSYLDGDINNASDVRKFFYGQLATFLSTHNCMVVIGCHYGQRAAIKKALQVGPGEDWSESQYAQAGNSNSINWARASINLTCTNDPRCNKLYYAKRGSRMGNARTWYIRHNDEHWAKRLMSWSEATTPPDGVTIDASAKKTPVNPNNKKATADDRARKNKDEMELRLAHVLALLQPMGELTKEMAYDAILSDAKARAKSDIKSPPAPSKTTIYRWLRVLAERHDLRSVGLKDGEETFNVAEEKPF